MKPDDERLTRLHEALVERVEQLVSGEDFMRFVAPLCQPEVRQLLLLIY